MVNTPRREPTLQDVLALWIGTSLNNLHVALPGQIESYDATKQTAQIKPKIQRLVRAQDETEFNESLPIIQDVPIIFPRCGQFFISFPLIKGDAVLLIFNDWSIDNYTVSQPGQEVNPDDFRNHALSDAVAIPGFFPNVSAIQQADTTNMALGKDAGGIQIHLTPGGVAEVKAGGTVAALSAAVAEHLQTFYTSQLMTLYNAHQHPTGVGPSGPPAVPWPGWDSTIASTKLKLGG